MTQLQESDVLVIGEALIDITENGAGSTEHVGGSPANVALGLGRRGVSVSLLTHLADDPRGWAVARHLSASQVTVLPESWTAERTSTARASIGADGQASYAFDLSWDVAVPDGSAAPVLHVGSIAAFLEPGATAVRQILTRGAKEVTFDPNIRSSIIGSRDKSFSAFEETARLATVVKMSDEDAEWLYPGMAPDQVLDTVLGLGPRLAAITLGSRGAIVVNPDYRIWIRPVSVPSSTPSGQEIPS